jgi:Ras-related protein Rab-1A
VIFLDTSFFSQWDTAGQERFRSITSSFYGGAHAICIVYDVTSQKSFEHMEELFKEVQGRYSEALKILVGNKADMYDQRIVSEEEGKCLAEKLKCPLWETSAKSAQNVETIFAALASQLIQKYKASNPKSEANQIELKQRAEDTGDQCCK